ncbi:sushi, nidogen and EGF-like domain-containing protein 1 isoform X1 [Exaiptasia diaphana]|uniref:NIDO domain-containing protein n=1 Tax=Exaiptasia diaphana TaxID=2652724 RepID=A0A913X0C8_EXADI|nr:sushi, nidogen and EGF-like domain-containing protein 1 isoform X1 [Exaiptasia diaphana]
MRNMAASLSFLVMIIQISILLSKSASVALDDFTPFGEDNGDVLMHRELDAVSGKINITTAFPFFGRKFTSLYVSSHGLISLEKAFAKYVPQQFPLSDMVTIIAPYWADVAQRSKGGIWYRQNSTKHLLEVASIDVRNAFLEFQHFSAIWMFVTTWEKVTFYQSTNKNITNTFQLILLTDGLYSFVRFNYQEISWTSATTSGGNSRNGLGGNEAGCGFNAGYGNYFYNVSWNSFRNIRVLDLPFKTNVGEPGVWMFRTDGITIQEPTGRITKDVILVTLRDNG